MSPPKEEKNEKTKTIDTGLGNFDRSLLKGNKLPKINAPKKLSPIVHKVKRRHIPKPQNRTLDINPIDEIKNQKPKRNVNLPPAPGVKLKKPLKDSDLFSHKVTGVYMKQVKVPTRNLSVPERTKKANRISLF